MRCKRHPFDPSSGVGICASCLRERLFAIIAAQARQQALAQAQAQAQAEADAEDRRKSNARRPPPLVFPRSVSPYIYSRSASDPSVEFNPNHHHNKLDQRFYSTPQVGSTSNFSTTIGIGGATPKKKRNQFSILKYLLGKFRSEDSNPHPTNSRTFRVSKSSLTTTSSSSSPMSSQNSFTNFFPSHRKKLSSPLSSQNSFSSFLPSHRKKLSRLFTFNETRSGRGHRPPGRRDRGISPERTTAAGELCGDYDDTSSYSSKSSPRGLQAQRTPPHATPTRSRRRGHHSRNVSGLAVCFSPLVRPSPSRHPRNVGISGEIGFSSEVRGSSKPHFPSAPSFCKNRSKKLADIGRYNNGYKS